jgi:hypothetical protein
MQKGADLEVGQSVQGLPLVHRTRGTALLLSTHLQENSEVAMNQQRRDKIAQAVLLLQEARDEEQDAFDNLPEGLQSGERGQAMEASVSHLDEAITSAEAAMEAA